MITPRCLNINTHFVSISLIDYIEFMFQFPYAFIQKKIRFSKLQAVRDGYSGAGLTFSQCNDSQFFTKIVYRKTILTLLTFTDFREHCD